MTRQFGCGLRRVLAIRPCSLMPQSVLGRVDVKTVRSPRGPDSQRPRRGLTRREREGGDPVTGKRRNLELVRDVVQEVAAVVDDVGLMHREDRARPHAHAAGPALPISAA